jgi:heterodisulfide reductase subunit A
MESKISSASLPCLGCTGVEQRAILIVDDDQIIRETLRDELESKGYVIDTAETAKEAMEKSKVRTFSLALLDIKLPDMEGTELLKKMHGLAPGMMKVMITAYGTLKNAMDSLNFGADAYLLKPINPKELLKTVEEKLAEQHVAEAMSEEKVAEWILTRLQKLEKV